MLLGLITLIIGVTAALALVVVGLMATRQSSARNIDERLERFGGRDAYVNREADGDSRRTPARLAQVVDQAVAERSFTATIRRDMARADLRLTAGEWLIIRGCFIFLGFALGYFVGRMTAQLSVLLGLMGVILGIFSPAIYLKVRISRRIKAFVGQLGDTITLMANALRAGYSLLQTMEMVTREMPAPISEEFRRVVHEVGLGINFQEAMAHLLRRVPSEDLDLMISAINIQHEVGGNLAQILDVIGHTIRERVRIKGEIGVLTAQQSISGYIISALPVVLGFVLFLVSPGYISKIFVFPWVCMPIGSGIMIIAGFLVMRKITAIEV